MDLPATTTGKFSIIIKVQTDAFKSDFAVIVPRNYLDREQFASLCSVFGRIFFSGALVHATQFDVDARRPCRKQGIEGEISWPASRSEQLTIQAPILDGLGDVG